MEYGHGKRSPFVLETLLATRILQAKNPGRQYLQMTKDVGALMKALNRKKQKRSKRFKQEPESDSEISDNKWVIEWGNQENKNLLSPTLKK